MGDTSGSASGGMSNMSGSGTRSGTQSTTATFTSQGQALIDRLMNYQPADVGSQVAAANAAIQANTRNQLPGIIAQARSGGYGKAANWGQGNIASAAANALGQRDVQLSGLSAQAAQQAAQNQLANNQGLASVLSLLRGENSVSTEKSSQSQKGFSLGAALGF